MNMTCIVCPVGCRMTVEEKDGKIVVTGNACKRGEKYALQESTCPMRTLTSLVKLAGGDEPLCPVKTDRAIPKALIGEALRAVKAARAKAPVGIGDIIIENIANTGANLVSTANRRSV